MRTFRTVWGARIRKARDDAGLSQSDFALAMGVDQATVSRWERGMASPADHRRPAIAAVLGVPVETLFSYTNGEAA